MRALEDITPDLEIFSVDEAFLDVTHCQRLHGSPIDMGHMTKERVFAASHLPCSIGISGDKTTAKYAAKLRKPDGFTVIPPWKSKTVYEKNTIWTKVAVDGFRFVSCDSFCRGTCLGEIGFLGVLSEAVYHRKKGISKPAVFQE